jgi:hypothetical protein
MLSGSAALEPAGLLLLIMAPTFLVVVQGREPPLDLSPDLAHRGNVALKTSFKPDGNLIDEPRVSPAL